jgi:transcriptional regulator with XRE-family HTH domain
MINAHALRTLRYDRGLSQRQLAVGAGVNPGTIIRLERGADGGELPLRVASRLASELGTGIGELTSAGAGANVSAEHLTRAVGAAAAGGKASVEELAATTQSTREAVDRAIDEASAALRPFGIGIARDGDAFWIVPAAPAMVLTTIRTMQPSAARLLKKIEHGLDVRRSLTRQEREVSLPWLIRTGLVKVGPTRLELTEAAEVSLLVGAVPPQV